MPPLRQRIQEEPEELKALVTRILGRMIGNDGPAFSNRICETIVADIGIGYPWPGNVRELEQAVRRILLTKQYRGDCAGNKSGLRDLLVTGIDEGSLDAQTLMAQYCRLLHQRLGTYEEVAKRTGLDRRTVRKYIHIE